jgi:hypothetical protein
MNLLKAAAVLAMLASPALAQAPASSAVKTPSAQNSGAGIPGQPGSKNGPSVNPGKDQTATSQQTNPTTSLQDTAKIPGKPGGKSGSAVMPPPKSANKQ